MMRRSERWKAVALFAALALLPARAMAQEAAVDVSGVVRDSAGFPLSYARVQVAGQGEIEAGSDGRFTLRGVTGEMVMLEVRRLGYQPFRGTLRVPPRGQSLDVRLEAARSLLPAVAVVAPAREVYDARLSAFEERRRRQLGDYITRDKIDRHASASVIDLLRGVRGVQITTLGSTMMTRVRLRNASCPPVVYMDGAPATAGEFDFGMIELSTLEGIEIYHGLASIPAGLSSGRGRERCGVIALWSRPTRVPEGRQARRDAAERAMQRERMETAVDLSALLATGNVYTADQVDQRAQLRRGVRLPVYPDSMFATRTPGRVLVEFVVDIGGRMVPRTYRVVSASHESFERAVFEALTIAEFTPAMIGAARVQQVVQLPFEFRPPRDFEF